MKKSEIFYDSWRYKNGITVDGYNLNRKQILQMLEDYRDYLNVNYPSTKAEDVIKRELHIEYLKAMNASRLPREQWESESEWLKGKK